MFSLLPIYLDPGSGSFLLQLLIAGIAGIAIAIGASWSKVKRFFSKKKTDRMPDDTEDEE